ncbi:hypothetical protein CRE_29871 [Caenorhabditis remanei]|uniref:Uncharacterized protein n=1 Tax=Caenorhabditis remanei TaxID=31234 RepID=E3MLX4_CAERE|nr:hypothetical protein CRE_29871 [Caenorhabditis remanei]
MMDDEDTIEKRRQRSDEARRAAMKLKSQQKNERDRQIAADIANVDKKATKRIVFESESEDEEEEKTAENKQKSTKSSSSSSSKRPKLFEDSGDEDGQEKDDEFEIKNRHSGPKGEQLMKMEARFNSDPRFKLDDKFAESDSDDDGNEAENAEKQEMKIEKDKNRELLSKILGKSVEEKKPKTAETATLKARPFTRFDPENPEHVAWMKEFEASKNPHKAKKTTETEDKAKDSDDEEKEDESEKNAEKEAFEGENDVESGDEDFEKAEIFFKMDEGFTKEMKERKETGESSAGGFSFLSMMGRKYEDEVDEEEVETVIEKNELVEKKKSKPVDKMEHVEKALLKVKVSTKFFVDPLSDEKIKSLAANFRRTQTVEKVIDKWAPHRDAIFKLWKKQRRDAVKKQKESFFTNGKRKRKAEDENGEATVNS